MTKCWFCDEDDATEMIRDPNKEQEDPFTAPIVDVCWDCKMYVLWSKYHMVATVLGGEAEPFNEWVFKREGVYPKKQDYFAVQLKKKPENFNNGTSNSSCL